MGTWSLTSECLDKGELTATIQQEFYCPQATVTSTQVAVSGTATFGSNLSFNIVQNITGTIAISIPSSCTGGLSCADYSAQMAPSLNPGNTFTCSGTSTCLCSEGITTSTTDSGTYTLSGSNLNITESGGAGALGYCVQGSTIHFITVDGSMHTGPGGQATIAKDIVGHKP